MNRLVKALRNPITAAGTAVVLVFVLIAILASVIAPYDPVPLDPDNRMRPPSLEHWFGTDNNGRDVLSRCLYGTQISMRAGATIVGISMIIGMLVGSVAAQFGGIVDDVLMRFVDVVLSFPALLLGMMIVTALGHSLNNAILALAIIRWPDYARLSRALILSESSKPYIEAARSVGASYSRIYFVHILRNIAIPIIIKATLDMGFAILLMASLSFIGLGASPPTPELGAMVARGRFYILDYPWVSFFPGLSIFSVALGFSLLGDGLQEFLDPQFQLRQKISAREGAS